MEKATFGAGCFWGVEAAFQSIPGVISTQVGYTGGWQENPTYKEVCSHTTGHAEVVEVTFDPERIMYGDLLQVFWECHDPTQLDRQGPDVGSQYRSVIFVHNETQKNTALAAKEERQGSGLHSLPIVTEIVPAASFYRAEEYHQRYLEKHGLRSCHL